MVMGGGAFHCLPLAPPNGGGTLYASAASAPTVSPGSMTMAFPSFSFVLVLDRMVPLQTVSRGLGPGCHLSSAWLYLSLTILPLHAASHALILKIRRVRLIFAEEASWARERIPSARHTARR